MSASSKIPIEQIGDRAIDLLLQGESPEDIVARYPDHAEQLNSILFTAQAMKRAPRPEIPTAFLSTLVTQAKAQAQKEAARRKTISLVVPVPPSTNGSANGYQAPDSVTTRKYNSVPAQRLVAIPVHKPNMAQRIALWLQPANSLVRIPVAVILLLSAVAGILAVVRVTEKPAPLYPPVPTVSAQFTFDGRIEQLGSASWVVGGSTISLDSQTVITGTPAVGGQAHISGAIKDGNRRVAREIIVRPGLLAPTSLPILPSVVTVSTPDVTPQWSIPEATPSIATASPAPTKMGQSAPTIGTSLPPVTTRVVSPDSTLPTVRVTQTLAPVRTSTAVTLPPKQPTNSGIVKAAKTAVFAPTRLPMSPTSSHQPAGTATSRPVSTTIVLETATILSTATTHLAATSTRLPETTVPLTATHVEATTSTALPTAAPAQSPTSTRTSVPVSTSTPRPTNVPDPSVTPRPEDTTVPRPTITTTIPPPSPTTINPTRTTVPTSLPIATIEPTHLPTSQPSSTMPPVATVTRSPEPEGTRTVEPTHGPGNTQTPQTTQTRGLEETHTPNHTEQAHSTETVEPTHSALPLP